MTTAVSEIARIKSGMTSRLQISKQNLNASKTELERLRAEYNIGNLSERAFQGSERRLQKSIDDARAEIARLQSPIEARTSGQVIVVEGKEESIGKRRGILPKWAIATAVVVPLLVIGLFMWRTWEPPRNGTPVVTPPPAESTAPTPPVAPPEETPPLPSADWADVIAKVRPSIVLILITLDYDKYYDASGSGIIVDKNGYILTNKHVLDRAREIDVYLYEGDEVIVSPAKAYTANIVRKHPTADLAIIKISPSQEGLREAILGDSAAVRQGDKVAALGYPYSDLFYDKDSGSVGTPSFTEGSVSALRELDDVSYIQTSAQVNPGSSGGALINTAGEVVGVTTWKVKEAEGMSMAIAIDYAKPFIKETIGK
jgi:S1-C subfamily serine protease